jgi:TPR repeat protein
MKNLTLTICLTLAVLLGSTGTSWGADFQKGFAAAQSGDFATALREWRPLAEQGHADAQYNLGVMYDEGRGVLQDDKTAVKWYTLAAEQGQAHAQFNLGLMYYNGEGVPQDYKTGVKWYTLAAGQGLRNAQFSLGVMPLQTPRF